MKTTFLYTGIRVKNLEESVRFYTRLLGMKETGRNRIEATGGTVVSLKSVEGGQELELNYYPKRNKYAIKYAAGEGLDHLAFKVEDLDVALAELGKAGHPTVLKVKGSSSRWAYVKDPNGIWIELFS
ncbi:MAG TPA: VOC family protein [Nitrososphaerales archaeon]|nr:VOC family protein [Nitrososphaerales archaeon]